ncbi:MAG TPA: hypothetical protein VL475_14715 [Planctomycetaceae bacterium]|nr:hypothetical protein [Planctomycetaceae bacterium]
MTANPQVRCRLPVAARSWRVLFLITIAFAGWLSLAASPQNAFAAGSESLRGAYEMSLTVDSRWAGGAHGGYYPIRIRLTNTARPRVLEFRFVDTRGDESKLPVVERRVQVDQNATLQFTLSVPLVSHGSGGELRVYENGRLLEQFSQHVSLSDAEPGTTDRPALLVIHPSPSSVDCSPFETAVQSLAAGAVPVTGGGMRWAGGMGGAAVRSNDFQVIAPFLLPESWIDYTALDVVAIPLATFEKLPTAARAAIVKWVEAGGTLLVTEVGEAGAESKTLARLLDLGSRSSASTTWSAADPALVKRITVNPQAGGVTAGGMPIAVAPAVPAAAAGEENAEQARLWALANQAIWPQIAATFSGLEVMAGRVYAFPGNPFPGAPVDWAWWLNSAQWSNRLNWTARFGNSSRQRHPGFFEFLIPGVGGVPVLPFVILISLFAIVIGPVNYFVVLRRKQLYLLVVTIPAIAFITSCALFGYAMIADGFRVQSRLRSFTLLDQGTRRAVAFNRISLYAGLAPSAGLRFSPETAVLPIWKDDFELESGTVDWTETQALTNGWLRSRTRTQFETIVHRDERGRIEFSATSADTPPDAANGLAWEIDTLVVRDGQGRIFSGRKIPAGGSLTLHPLEPGDLKTLTEAVSQFPLKAPPGAENEPSPFNYRTRRSWMYGYAGGARVSFSNSLLETGLQRLTRADRPFSEGGLAPRSYFATFRENPGIELGIERTIPRDGVHVLLGSF